jgi:peptidoglycan LD-endopeptidase CwlK
MQDSVTVARVNALHPKVIGQFTSFIDAIETATGRIFRMVQGGRTFAQQDAIYAQGRTKPGKIVTNAKGGQSYHCYWIAGDIVPFMIGSTTELDWAFNFQTIRQIAIDNGLECGMDWPKPLTDLDHFENRFGYSWEQLLEKYNAKDFIPNTTFVNL